jgi:hypothetical protein
LPLLAINVQESNLTVFKDISSAEKDFADEPFQLSIRCMPGLTSRHRSSILFAGRFSGASDRPAGDDDLLSALSVCNADC